MSDASFPSSLRLIGRHVELHPLMEEHLPGLVPGLLDWPTVQFLRAPPGPTPEEAAAWIRRWFRTGEVGPDLPFATVLRSTGAPIGMTSFLRLDRASRGVEIGGTWLHRAFWRTAVNTEAKFLMLRYAFEEAGIHRVQLQTDLRNLRSQRAIEGLGALREARLREDVLLPDGSFRTSCYFSILEDEWPAVRARLTARLDRPWSAQSPDGGPAPAFLPEPIPAARPRVEPPPIRFRPPVRLMGQTIRLVPLERFHLPELTRVGAAPEIWTWLRIRHGDTPEGMAGLVDDLLSLQDAGHVLAFVVQRQDDDRICGVARYLDIDRENRWVEVGTWLHPGVWRTPVNTELKLLLFRYAFETEHAHRVQLKTDLRNDRSQRAIERLGAVYEGERRDHYRFPNGDYRTSKYYSILGTEWPTVRERLEGFLRRPWTTAPAGDP